MDTKRNTTTIAIVSILIIFALVAVFSVYRQNNLYSTKGNAVATSTIGIVSSKAQEINVWTGSVVTIEHRRL